MVSAAPLSVIVPALNEEASILACLERVLAQDFIGEVIVVDDGSTDSTAEKVQGLSDPRVRLISHSRNRGKGAAIRSGIRLCSREFVAIQDADLEYDPAELAVLLEPLQAGHADVVYGSRFMATGARRALFFWHSMGNKALTIASNMVSNLNLTDMETCYKVFRREVLDTLVIEENRFGIEPELTIKSAIAGLRVYEVGISYHGRTYAEGKKIGWRDGISAARCIVNYSLVERTRRSRKNRIEARRDAADLHASLEGLRDADNYYAWIADLMQPYLGASVLEIGAGVGTFSKFLSSSERHVTAVEPDPEAFKHLHLRFSDDTRVTTMEGDSSLASLEVSTYDSVVLVNVLEHIADEVSELERLFQLVKPGGYLLIWVPAHELLYARFDEAVGHFRRYNKRRLSALADLAGFETVSVKYVNPVGALGWLAGAKLLRQTPTDSALTSFFDRKVVPWARKIERPAGSPFGQSALLIARR